MTAARPVSRVSPGFHGSGCLSFVIAGISEAASRAELIAGDGDEK
jgi:hypothetical protein